MYSDTVEIPKGKDFLNVNIMVQNKNSRIGERPGWKEKSLWRPRLRHSILVVEVWNSLSVTTNNFTSKDPGTSHLRLRHIDPTPRFRTRKSPWGWTVTDPVLGRSHDWRLTRGRVNKETLIVDPFSFLPLLTYRNTQCLSTQVDLPFFVSSNHLNSKITTKKLHPGDPISDQSTRRIRHWNRILYRRS